MIQINLLPDVKVEYLKSKRMRRLVMGGSLIAIIASFGIVAFIGSYAYGVQKAQLASLNSSIAKSTAEIKKIDNLDKILTIQNQLKTLDEAHSGKPAMTRLFTFLPQLTPTDVQISDLGVTYETSAMTIKGTAKNVESVNKFVDTLKFTTFTVDNDPNSSKKAFNSVVLSKIGVSPKGVDYSLDLNFDPKLFDITVTSVELTVPKITTTRSDLTVPNALFKVELPTAGQSTGAAQ